MSASDVIAWLFESIALAACAQRVGGFWLNGDIKVDDVRIVNGRITVFWSAA